LSEYIDELVGNLEEVGEREGREVLERCCQLWRCAKEHKRKSSCRRSHYLGLAVELMMCIISLGGERATTITREVFSIIDSRHRASSAVEGFNSLLRPHLYIHKRVSQDFLELFRACLVNRLQSEIAGGARDVNPQDVVCISWICASSWGSQIGCITRLQPEIYLRDRP